MTNEQIIARLDKRDRDYKTELADLEQRIGAEKAASEAAEAALDAATCETDPDAYRKAKREAAFHNDALEMMQRRRETLHQPPISEEEYKEMTGYVLDDMEAELASVMEWAVETADLAAQYLGELGEKSRQANSVLRRLAKASGRDPREAEKLHCVQGTRFSVDSAIYWLKSIFEHYSYEVATGKKKANPLADNRRSVWANFH